MKMSLGQVVAQLFGMFERRYGGDREMAAMATQVIVNDLLCREELKRSKPARRAPRTTRPRARTQRVLQRAA